jgi:hypothetical protein
VLPSCIKWTLRSMRDNLRKCASGVSAFRATRLRAQYSKGFESRKVQDILLFRPALAPIQPTIQRVPAFFPGRKTSRDVTLTTHLHLVPRLRISGAVPPLPPVSLHGVDRNNFHYILQSRIYSRPVF